jgi:hypothetical protein
MPEKSVPPIWPAFCSALSAEFRPTNEIQGVSGLTHPVQAIAVDDKGKRLIVVSAEHNPRVAALMRVDIQSTMPDVRVLVARPLAVDLAYAARTLVTKHSGRLDKAKLRKAARLLTQTSQNPQANDQLAALFGPDFKPLVESVVKSGLPITSHLMHAFEQLAVLDWQRVWSKKGFDLVVEFLSQVRLLDNLEGDRREGICPIPTYELTEDDWELFASGTRIDDVRERLKAMGVYQYFFPPQDNVALGLIDRGFNTVELVERGVELAARDGHVIAPNTIVPDADNIPDLMAEFRTKGLTLEANYESEELTADGKTIRRALKVKPAEGLIERLSKIVSIKIDLNLKDLFGPRP